MTTWYLIESSSENRPSGPFDIEQLAMMASSGRLRSDSLVVRVGDTEWIAAERDAELAGFFRAAPPTESFTPSAPSISAAPPPFEGAGDYAFGAAFELGTTTFRRRWGHMVIVGLVFLAISAAIGVPQGIAEAIGEASGDRETAIVLGLFGSCTGFILQVLVGIPLFAGLTVAAANAVRGRTEVGDLFIGFRRYGRVLLASLVFMAITTAVAMVAYLVAFLVAMIFGFAGGLAGGVVGGSQSGMAGAVGGIAIGLLVAVVIVVIGTALVLVRVAFVPAMVADPTLGELSLGDAMSRNWKATRGLGVSLVGLLLVVGLLASLSVLLLCVGYVLLGLPLLIAVLGATYELVIRGKASPPPTAPGASA